MTGKLILGCLDIGNIRDISQRTIESIQKCKIIIIEDPYPQSSIIKTIRENNNSIDLEIIVWPVFNDDYNDYVLNKIKTETSAGRDILYLSGEGMPGITDPGTGLVRFAIENKIKYTALPGPSIISLMPIMSGLCCEGFFFERFIPTEREERRELLNKLFLFDRPILSVLLTIGSGEVIGYLREILDDILDIFSSNTEISIGINLSTDSEIILSNSICDLIEEIRVLDFPEISKLAMFIVPYSRLDHNCL